MPASQARVDVFRLTEPSAGEIDAFLRVQREQPLSYPEAGITRSPPVAGYTVDHNRVRLGHGPQAYARAAEALRRWQHFRLGWVRLFPRGAPVEPGTTVAVLVRMPGVWSLNACRIVYAIGEDPEGRRFGFAYGTLPDHAERGEERFTVEWRADDDSVWYDIFALSRPAHVLSRIGYPFTRRLQKRFALDSKQAMVRAMSSPESPLSC